LLLDKLLVPTLIAAGPNVPLMGCERAGSRPTAVQQPENYRSSLDSRGRSTG
jgi:hypothetical protein